MPLHNLGNGCWRWGDSGAKYCGKGAREKALRQMRAIEWRKHSGASMLERFTKANLEKFNVESIIFEKTRFNQETAQQWLNDNGYAFAELEDCDEFYLATLPREDNAQLIEYEPDILMLVTTDYS